MARRERRHPARGGRGLWGAIFSLAALAGVTFVVGAIAGLIWREPSLLVAHLTGETREVAWGAAPPSVAAAPEVSVAEPARAALARPKPSSEKPRPKRSASPAVAAAPPLSSARFAIQVGAFAERDSAELLRGELQKGGYPAYVAVGAASGTPRWRVRVGPYPSREDADGIAAQLKSARALPTWVLDEDAQ